MTKISPQVLAYLTLTLCLASPAGLRAQITDVATFDVESARFSSSGVMLSQDGTTLYGTTELGGADGSGALFSVPVGGGTPMILARFNETNGQRPTGGLVLSPDGGTFYGTAEYGGAYGNGVVFSVPVSGGVPTVLASFNGAYGTVPSSGLVLSGGILYGTTSSGGSNNDGVVFSVSVTGGTPKILTSFNDTNGQTPAGRLVLSGNTLYGVTESGGAYGGGEVFSLPIGGGAPTILTSFSNPYGSVPLTGLLLSGNLLYGTARGGGANGDGVVFSLPITGGTPTVLASFNGADGQMPSTDLLLSPDGSTLYGATFEGGANNDGVVFSVPVAGGTPTVLDSFNGADGNEPVGELVLSGNTLYGTTNVGGADNFGVVFSVPGSVPEPGCVGLLLAGAMAVTTHRRRTGSLSRP